MSYLLVSVDSAGTLTSLAQAAGAIVIAYIGLLWLAGVAWVWGDVSRRTTDAHMRWLAIGLAALLFVPGLLLYVALRPADTIADREERRLEAQVLARQGDAVPACPNCHRRLGDDFVRCPYCAWKLGEQCDSCQRMNLAEWVVCPYCGTGARAIAPAPVNRLAPTKTVPRAAAPRTGNSLKPVS